MEVAIRGLSEKSLEELQNEFSKKSLDFWHWESYTEEDYYTVDFYCEGICVLKNTIMVMIADFGLIHLEIPKDEYHDIEIR